MFVVAIALLAVLASMAGVGRAAPRPDIGESIGAAAVGGMTLAMTGIDAIGQGAAIRGKSETNVGEFWCTVLLSSFAYNYSTQIADVLDQKFDDKREMEAGLGKAVQAPEEERKKRAAQPCGRGGGGGGSGGGGGGEAPGAGGDTESVPENGELRSQKMRKGKSRGRREADALNGSWIRKVREVGDNGDADETQFTQELSAALQRFVDSARRVANRVRELFQAAGGADGSDGGNGGQPGDFDLNSEVEQM